MSPSQTTAIAPNIRFLAANSHWAVPGRPTKDQTGRNLLARLRIGRHCLGRPPKILFQRSPEAWVVREGCVVERLGETKLRSFIHFGMFSFSRMHTDHVGLSSHRCSVVGGPAERLRPIGRQAL